MKKVLLAILIMVCCAAAVNAESSLLTYPSQPGLDAAMAINGMHDAVMRDVLGTDYSFSQLAGGDEIFVLFTDSESENYLMISLTDEADSRADMAIIQSYSLKEFETHAMDSLTAIAMPFIPEEHLTAFEQWRDNTRLAAAEAYKNNQDMELTYYTGEYITCAMSVMHDSPDRILFTAIVSWNVPLTADDISAIMEVPSDAE